jgi:hypothetical protein
MTILLQLLFLGNVGLTELIILVVFVLLVFMLPFRLYNRKRDKPIVKYIFGILYLLIALALIGLGIAALNDAATKDKALEEQISNELRGSYYPNNNGEKMLGVTLITIGLFFLISGIILIVTKSKAQRIKDAEIKPTVEDKLAQIEKLGEMKEKGLITEEEFQQQKKRILE